MSKGAREIYYMFNGKLIGNRYLKLCICRTLSKMPDEVVGFVTASCWFVGSMEDAYAFTFTGNDIKGQHLIFLSEDLMRQSEEQIEHSIAHEIAHVILGHRNSVLLRQSKEEIKRQEKEADEFTKNLGF